MSEIESDTATPGFSRWNSQRSTGNDGAPGPGGGAHLEGAAQLAARARMELFDHLALEGKHPLGAAVESKAGLRRLDAAAGTVEQPAPEPLLQRADLEADGRLGDPEPLGSLREALPLDDGAERGKLARVHKHAYSES